MLLLSFLASSAIFAIAAARAVATREALAPVLPLLVRTLPSWFTTSQRLGRDMLRVVQGRAGHFILESADINRIGT